MRAGEGAFLPDLLVAALQGAVALAEMDRVALAVAEHLDLDVARLLEIFLDIDRVVAESSLGLGLGGLERVEEIVLVARHLHAASAAAGSRLDDDRIADVLGDLPGLGLVGDAALGAGHAGDAEALGRALGFDLVAHDADMLRLRADEGDAVMLEHLREARVLGQEAVAGMDRIRAGDLAGGDQGRDVEIAVAGGRRADAHALVGEAHMHGVRVGGGMDRHGGDAELLRRAQDSQGDLASVGNEDLIEHVAPYSMTRRGSPYSTGVPSST